MFLGSRGFFPASSRGCDGHFGCGERGACHGHYGPQAAPSRSGADKLEVSFSCLLLLASASSGWPVQTGSEREMITSISVRSGSCDL